LVPGSNPGGGVMKIHSYTDPFPFLYIEEFYTQDELDLIWKELDFYVSNRENIFIPDLLSAHENGQPLKSNSGVFLDEMHANNRSASHILNFNRKLFEVMQAEDNWFFKNLYCNHDTTLLSYYCDSDYYAPHYDKSVCTACTWLHKDPITYVGGEFSFTEFDRAFMGNNNCTVIFPGQVKHSVTQVNGYGRWCISQFLNHI
jgi:hypothetical protein